jgi:uncharacterized protein YbaA (DUF1428 family)
MAKYVRGAVSPVPIKKLAAYKKLARVAGKAWIRAGALEYHECLADDVKPGKVTSFPQAVNLKKGETIVFSWVVYKSRKHCDSVVVKVMKDPVIANMNPKNLPFDGMRMFWGGFKPFLEL